MLLYRMRNLTKDTYEYVWLEDIDPLPTTLPDNPLDEACAVRTVIVSTEIE